MNWEELKKFANTLDEKQLERNVILWREGEVIDDIDGMALEADYYIGKDEEGCYPLEDAGLTIEDVKKKKLKKVYDKGTPILWEDF